MSIRPLSSELQEIATNELNEVPSRIQADIEHIREWISKQPHLKARTDDQWLLCFLRACKFSLQKTKEKLDVFYTAKKLMPEFFSNRDPFVPEIQELLRQGILIVLPKTASPGAPRIIISRNNKMDPKKVAATTFFTVLGIFSDILLMEDDNYTVAGMYTISDLKNFSYSYASQLTPNFFKKIVMCTQHVYPIRVKAMYYLNAHPLFVTLYNWAKSFIVQKLRNRVFVYGEDASKNFSISKEIPLAILPKEYGGEEISCDEIAAYWKSKVESYREWLLDDVQYCTDESKRVGKSKLAEEMFGVEGSFKKLEVD